MSRNRNIGEKGEKIALDYLRKEGYEIIATNWTAGHKEIDIITK
jgi:putative endonuclease